MSRYTLLVVVVVALTQMCNGVSNSAFNNKGQAFLQGYFIFCLAVAYLSSLAR